MKKDNINNLRRKIIYRCKYTGTKETDLLFSNLIIKKINKFSYIEILDILKIIDEFSDNEIYLILSNKKKSNKYLKIFKKIKNEIE